MSEVEYIPRGLSLAPRDHGRIASDSLKKFQSDVARAAHLSKIGDCDGALRSAADAWFEVGRRAAHRISSGEPVELVSNRVDVSRAEVFNAIQACVVKPHEDRFAAYNEVAQGEGWQEKKIFGMPWWVVVGGGILVLAGLGKGTQVVVAEVKKRLSISEGIKTYSALLDAAAKNAGIPKNVLITFIALESSFRSDEYNPEKSAIDSWSCKIAGNEKWKANPDYANAVQVCNLLKKNPSEADRLAEGSKTGIPFEKKLWKHGSFGLGQMSAIAARAVGFPYSRSNKDLFKPEVNLPLVAKLIDLLRDKLFPGRTDLSTEEWARVRVAYVGGTGLDPRGEKGTEIASRFVSKYGSIIG